MMKSLLAGLLILTPSLAFAEAPLGLWSNATTALSVTEDGTFGWTTSDRVTAGEWSTTGPMMSLDAVGGPLTYAYEVADDRLTLTDTSGAQLVFQRSGAKPARR